MKGLILVFEGEMDTLSAVQRKSMFTPLSLEVLNGSLLWNAFVRMGAQFHH